MTQVVIVDLDGTFADCRHRLHHVTEGNRNWDEFFKTMGDDPMVEQIYEVCWAMVQAGYRIFICTGRPEDYREVTTEWLMAHNIPYDMLLMRPKGDFIADHIVKQRMLDHIQNELGRDIFMVIDDRQSVVDMWRANGLYVLQPKLESPDYYPESAHLTIMVGPAGAGKTSWALGEWGYIDFGGYAVNHGIHPSHVISADQIRQDVLGDFKSREHGDQIFGIIRELAQARLTRGLPTVIDATHLHRKQRLANVTIVPPTVPVTYVVINRSMEEKFRDGGWRNDIETPEGQKHFMQKHEDTFQAQKKDIMRGDDLPNVTVWDLSTFGTATLMKAANR